MSRLHPSIAELVWRYGLPRIEKLIHTSGDDLDEALELRPSAFVRPARLEVLRRLLVADQLECPESLLGLPGVSGPAFKGSRPWARLRAAFGGTMDGVRRKLLVKPPTLAKWIREGVPAHGIREIAQRFVTGHWEDVRFCYTWRLGRWVPEDQYADNPVAYGVDACVRGITAEEIVSGIGVVEALVVLPWIQGRGPIPEEGIEEYAIRGIAAYDLKSFPQRPLVPDASRNEVKFS